MAPVTLAIIRVILRIRVILAIIRVILVRIIVILFKNKGNSTYRIRVILIQE